jgi:hypothetical protein
MGKPKGLTMAAITQFRETQAMPTQEDAMIAWCKEQQVLLIGIAERFESEAIVRSEKKPNGKLIDWHRLGRLWRL